MLREYELNYNEIVLVKHLYKRISRVNKRYKVLPVHVGDEQRVAAPLQVNPRLHEVGCVELRRLEEETCIRSKGEGQ